MELRTGQDPSKLAPLAKLSRLIVHKINETFDDGYEKIPSWNETTTGRIFSVFFCFVAARNKIYSFRGTLE